MSRAQAHTLEGVVASLLLLSAVVFALQMTAVTPLSASTSSQHLENQQSATARGILGSAADSGALKRAILSWNESTERFYNTSELGYFTTDPPANEFGRMLNRSFDREGITYNVYLNYLSASGDSHERQLVYRGRPSDNAVRSSWTVTILDDDPLYDQAGNPTGTTVAGASSFYAGDASSSDVYNVVRVEVVVWRI